MCGHKPVRSVGIQIQYSGKDCVFCFRQSFKKLSQVILYVLRILRLEVTDPYLMVETKAAKIDKGVSTRVSGIGNEFKIDVMTVRKFLFQKVHIILVTTVCITVMVADFFKLGGQLGQRSSIINACGCSNTAIEKFFCRLNQRNGLAVQIFIERLFLLRHDQVGG